MTDSARAVNINTTATPNITATPTAKKSIALKKGRDKPIRQGHPWIFSGAIGQIPHELVDGDLVDVVDSGNNWLARGYLNRKSQIQVRVLTRDRHEFAPETDETEFWQNRLARAIELRRQLFTPASPTSGSAGLPDTGDTPVNAYRLINGESDELPGLIVDRYGDYLVMEVGTLGIDRRKQLLAEQLLALTGAQGIIERSDTAARRQEGLTGAEGLVAGTIPSGPVEIRENNLRFEVDLLQGQKTGFYLDQRVNRQRVAAYCAPSHFPHAPEGPQVLNAFAYTGAFAVHALAAGARHVTNIDTSAPALEQATRHLTLNGMDPAAQAQNVVGDVFQTLRAWRDANRAPFDVIILDPPKFAQSRQGVDKALRAYKDVNLLAMQLLRPGGILATFSCSGLVDAALFQKVIFGAAVDANRHVRVLEWLRQAPDHPVAITFPEGEYLKGLICHVA
ncbi:MAG: class I SAM-dependent rRNA methyltransferase [Litorilinea sp.]